jgi:inosine/xanthosine triphosphatase
MKKIIVGSKNPVKIKATLKAFKKVFKNEKFKIEGVDVPSGVPSQPMGNEQTIKGSLNRANNAYKKYPGADYYVGLEGGLEELDGSLYAFGWVSVKGKKMIGKGRSPSNVLPQDVTKLIKKGIELGKADDIVFGRKNSKESNGTIGILTHDLITRTDAFTLATILALIPFVNQKLYK